MPHLRPSKWIYKFDAASGTSADAVIASGGAITLLDPAGKPQRLYFGRSRIDPSASGETPRIALPLFVLPDPQPMPTSRSLLAEKKRHADEPAKQLVMSNDQSVGAEQSTQQIKQAQAPATKFEDKQDVVIATSEPRTVFMTNALFGEELRLGDLRGGAVFVDARARLFPGADACALLLGINASEMMFGLSTPDTFWMAERAIAQARGAAHA
jgi:hypothetical protein